MAKQTIRDLDLKGRKVFIRVDFNVPQDQTTGAITDDRRIRSALPTIQYALDQGAAVILASHLGRPKGKPVETFRLDAVAARLQELLGRPVTKLDEVVGPKVKAVCEPLKPGEVVLLENLRFHPLEEEKDPEKARPFAAELAALTDAYVNDAFGTCHRDHASMLGVPSLLPEQDRAIGFLVEKELQVLDTLLRQPKLPMIAIMGGAKVSDKIKVIENLLPRLEQLLIGGAMSYTFLKAQGHPVGNSLVEGEEGLAIARSAMELAGDKLVLPQDFLITRSETPPYETQVVEGPDIPDGWAGMDIGPKTIAAYREAIQKAGTVVWNGPVGKFEDEPFREGTRQIAEALAHASAVTVVGGGETAEAIEKFGFDDRIDHVSTGGGAFLEYLQGEPFNPLAVIPDR